jgi:hypothetical protein
MLRERYEQLRARALERSAIAIRGDLVMHRGMRSWMESGSWEEAPAFPEGRAPADQSLQQIVTVWASVLVGQAERSYGGQREA